MLWAGRIVSTLPVLLLLFAGINLRGGDPVVLPIMIGVLAWLGLYLRDARIRALIPLQK